MHTYNMVPILWYHLLWLGPNSHVLFGNNINCFQEWPHPSYDSRNLPVGLELHQLSPARLIKARLNEQHSLSLKWHSSLNKSSFHVKRIYNCLNQINTPQCIAGHYMNCCCKTKQQKYCHLENDTQVVHYNTTPCKQNRFLGEGFIVSLHSGTQECTPGNIRKPYNAMATRKQD